jgi:hypothetical protein
MEDTSMKHLRFALLLLVFASACGGDNKNPNGPSENPPTFAFALTTAQEVPPIANAAEAGASGNVTIKLNLTRDSSQTITAATVDFQVTLSGFPAGSTISAAHIHEAPSGQAAGVLLGTGVSSGDVALTNGAGSFTRNGVSMSPEIAQRILNNPAGFYFNVHTVLNPAGVIRGQLVRTN